MSRTATTEGCGLCIATASMFSPLLSDRLRMQQTRHAAETGARLHGDSGGGLAVEAAADDIGQRRVAQGGHGYAVGLVGDGVHLLDELQRREGRVAIHHLVQDAAQAPHVRWPPHLPDPPFCLLSTRCCRPFALWSCAREMLQQRSHSCSSEPRSTCCSVRWWV